MTSPRSRSFRRFPTLASAVVRAEAQGGTGETEDGGEAAPPPRPTAQEDANTRRRNRKIFGALLLGTLERFREEDQKLQGSEVFVRRNSMLRKAEQKAAAERETLLQRERQRQVEERKAQMVLRAQLLAETEEKETQLLLLMWRKHHSNFLKFYKTRSQPPLFFRPAVAFAPPLSEDLEEQQHETFERWLELRTQEVASFAEENLRRHLDHVEAQVQRWGQPQGRLGVAGAECVPLQGSSENGGANNEVERDEQLDRGGRKDDLGRNEDLSLEERRVKKELLDESNVAALASEQNLTRSREASPL